MREPGLRTLVRFVRSLALKAALVLKVVFQLFVGLLRAAFVFCHAHESL